MSVPVFVKDLFGVLFKTSYKRKKQKHPSLRKIFLNLCLNWVFPRIGGKPPKWMVKIMENPMNKWMIWGVFPLFLETPNWKLLFFHVLEATLNLWTPSAFAGDRHWWITEPPFSLITVITLGWGGVGGCVTFVNLQMSTFPPFPLKQGIWGGELTLLISWICPGSKSSWVVESWVVESWVVDFLFL